MDVERADFTVVMMARLLAEPAERVKRLWEESKGRHGDRPMTADRRASARARPYGWSASKTMADLGIAGVQPRRLKRTTLPAPDGAAHPELLRRRFDRPAPTTYLVGDITYLATVIDLTTRMVGGWQTADHYTQPADGIPLAA